MNRVMFLCMIFVSSLATADEHYPRFHGLSHHSHPHRHFSYPTYQQGYYPGYFQSVSWQPVSPFVAMPVFPYGAPVVAGYWPPPAVYSQSITATPINPGLGSVAVPVVAAPVANLPAVRILPIYDAGSVNVGLEPSQIPAKPSTAAGRLRSLQQQVLGDEKFRKGLWGVAYTYYRSAADAASDRGEARFRLGFCFATIKQYSSAVRDFKRGLFLNPEIASSGIASSTLFGPDSEVIRTSVVNKVAEWVREDSQDSDRWFLLGILLHFEGDERSRTVLQTGRQLTSGNHSHFDVLLASEFMAPAVSKPARLLELPKPPTKNVDAIPPLKIFP